MKITGVKTLAYEYTSERPLADANFPYGTNTWAHLAILVTTDEGLLGTAITLPAAEPMVHRLASLLIGEDPRGVRELWKKMVDHVFKGGNRGVASEAIAGLDLALWDLKAKANDEPLYRTLGANDPRVRAYASDIGMSLSDSELGDFFRSMANVGISAGKLKVGLDQERDMARLAIMRDALASTGKKTELAIDSNEYWSPKEAIRRIREIEDSFDLIWAEEPAGRWNPTGLKKVSDNIRAAVASGENLKDVPEFVPHFTTGSMDIAEIGNYTSGITGAQLVADLAYAFEIPVCVMNTPGNFMGHFAAALANHMMIEVVNAGMEVGFTVDHRIVDGFLIPGDSPGLGIAFNQDIMDALQSRQSAEKAGFVMPGRREGAGLYVVGPGSAEADPPRG